MPVLQRRTSFLIATIVCGVACALPVPVLALPAAALLLFYLPGRQLCRLLPTVDRLPGQGWMAIGASFVLTPLLLHIAWQFSNDWIALWASAVALNLLLAIIIAVRLEGKQERTTRLFDERWHLWAFSSLIAWVAACVFLFYWLPVAGDRLIESPSGDYVKHHAILWSLDRYPLPLHSVFFAAESDTPRYYYEHFHLLTVGLSILAHRTIALTTAFAIVAAIADCLLVGTTFLLAKSFLKTSKAALLSAMCVSIVGGWDIVAVVIRTIVTGRPQIVLDAWIPVTWRVHNIMNSFIWCPQHIAAIAILLLACYWLSHAPRARCWILLAPLVAASLFGMSIYIALFAFVSAAGYCVVEWITLMRTNRQTALRFGMSVLAIAMLGLVFMLPRAFNYAEMSRRYQGGVTVSWERFPYAFLGRLAPPGPLANWLEAPWLLPIEFGVGLIALFVVTGTIWRRLWTFRGTRLLMIASLLAIAAVWVIRSDVNPFDYAYRMGTMLIFILMALCVGAMVESQNVRPRIRPIRIKLLIVGIILGLPVGLYETPVLAVRTLLERKPAVRDTAALQALYEQASADDVVQGCPRLRTGLAQLVNRQIGVLRPDDSHVNVLRPRNPERMQSAYEDVVAAFETESSRLAYELLRKWEIQYILVGTWEHKAYDTCPQFEDPQWFETIYRDEVAAVYRLLDSSD